MSKCKNGHILNTKNLYLWVRKDGRKVRACRVCRGVATAKHQSKPGYVPREKNPMVEANAHLKRTYGITLDDKKKMLSKQDRRCANISCRRWFRRLSDAHVDHDHITKQVRGLLCGFCNRAAGLLNDDPVLLQGLAIYLNHTTDEFGDIENEITLTPGVCVASA